MMVAAVAAQAQNDDLKLQILSKQSRHQSYSDDKGGPPSSTFDFIAILQVSFCSPSEEMYFFLPFF